MSITSIGTTQSLYATQRSAVSTASNSVKISEADLKNIYTQSAVGTASESSSKSTNGLENEAFYSELAAKAASSEEYIAEQKEKFADMYVTSAAHEYFSANKSKITSGVELVTLLAEIASAASREGCMPVPIEAGELPQFMDTIQNALNDGMSLEDILKQKYDDHIQNHGEEGHTNSFADWFAINTSTGEVMSACPISRMYSGDSLNEQLSDVEAVMELADDLTTFLRYALISHDEDDSEKIDELFSFLKNKQAYADYNRFFADGDSGAADDIIERLIAAGVLKSDDEEDEEAVDRLMEAIRIHQEELRENRIDMEESERVIAEIQKIIDDDTKE